jgi:hypothetical protein
VWGVSTKEQKREVMLAHLEKSDSVYVKFDARREGVVLPSHLRRDAAVVLQYGLNMRIPIPDLDVGEEGIGATLSFNRSPVWTFIPWSAVFAIVSENGARLWEGDFPRDLELDDGRGAAPARGRRGPEQRPSKPASKRPSLRAVDGGRREDDASLSKPPAPPSGGEKMASLIDELPPEPPTTYVAEPAPSSTEPSPSSSQPASASAPSDAPAPPSTSEPEPAAAEANGSGRPEDEIVELPTAATKKKRELPPWLRVVK